MTFAYNYGAQVTVNASFTLSQYNRRANSSQVALGVRSSSGAFTTSAAGFIGLLPWTAEELLPNVKEQNFLYQLKSQGLITQNIVALYTSGSSDSIVKFGGWDKEGILDSDPSKL